MQEILLKIRYFKRGLSKSLKKLYNFISFWTQFLLMDKVIKNKRGMELVTSHSSGHQKTPLFVIYYLNKFDDVYSVKQFLSYSKTHICKFMQVNSWYHKLFHFPLSFWIWKLWKGRGKITKIWISENEKSFLDEVKNIFHSFYRAIIL